MSEALSTTLEQIEAERRAGTRRVRALGNLAKAGSYQAMALKRQALMLARLPYGAMLAGVLTAGEDLPVAPGCAMCEAYAERVGKLERLVKARGMLADLSKAVSQTAGAVESTMRLKEYLDGKPDSRAETRHVSIQAWLALLTDEQFKLFEGWVRAAEGRGGTPRVLEAVR